MFDLNKDSSKHKGVTKKKRRNICMMNKCDGEEKGRGVGGGGKGRGRGGRDSHRVKLSQGDVCWGDILGHMGL